MSKLLENLLSYEGMDWFLYNDKEKTLYITSKDEDLSKTKRLLKNQRYISTTKDEGLMLQVGYEKISKEDAIKIILNNYDKEETLDEIIDSSGTLSVYDDLKFRVVVNISKVKGFRDVACIREIIKNLSIDEIKKEIEIFRIKDIVENYQSNFSYGTLSVNMIKSLVNSYGMDKAMMLIKEVGVVNSNENKLSFEDKLNFNNFFKNLEVEIGRDNFLDIMPCLIKSIDLGIKMKESLVFSLNDDEELKEVIFKAMPELNKYKIKDVDMFSEDKQSKTVYFEINREAFKKFFYNIDVAESDIFKHISKMYREYEKLNDNIAININRNNCYILYLKEEHDVDISSEVKLLTSMYVKYLSEVLKDMKSTSWKVDNKEFFQRYKAYKNSKKIDESLIANEGVRKRRKI